MKLNYVIMISITLLLSGCFIGGGTHGSIQGSSTIKARQN
jgi:hypothetical protein